MSISLGLCKVKRIITYPKHKKLIWAAILTEYVNPELRVRNIFSSGNYGQQSKRLRNKDMIHVEEDTDGLHFVWNKRGPSTSHGLPRRPDNERTRATTTSRLDKSLRFQVRVLLDPAVMIHRWKIQRTFYFVLLL